MKKRQTSKKHEQSNKRSLRGHIRILCGFLFNAIGTATSSHMIIKWGKLINMPSSTHITYFAVLLPDKLSQASNNQLVSSQPYMGAVRG